ncbi:MAG: efflux RND transporter periplasmic adaptor subunit [Verrucomicrobiota bacterium]
MKILSLTAIFIGSAFAASAPRNENTIVLDTNAIQNLGIETVAAEETAFESTVPVLGEIEHTCESHSILSSRIAGKIIEAVVHKGDFVKKGDVMLRIESRQPGDPPPVIELKAPADGLVVRSDGHLGAPVEPDKELMEILDLTNVWAVARVPQHQAALLKEGLTARIRIPALGTEEKVSTFLQLNTNEEPNPTTVEAIFELPNPDIKLRPGMRAELSLIASKRENVLSIPREALQGDRSNRFVFIKDYELKNAYVRIPVVVGEISDNRVEITSGLFPGDEVVVNGAYALSFAGEGSVSLKDAMDAAHGHPHNEDGSEMSAEEIAASDDEHGHDHGPEGISPLVIFLTITCGVLLMLLVIASLSLRARSKT